MLDRIGTGAPVVGSPIMFVEPDGTITRTMTDSNGKPQAEVFAGTSVTSVATISNGRQMQTVLAVAPGDDIVVGRTNPDEGTATTFVITLRNSCNPASMELMVHARNSANATLGFSSKSNVSVAAGNTTMPAFSTGSNISFTATYTNISNTFRLTMDRKTPDGLGHTATVMKSISGVASTTANVLDPNTEKARVDTRLAQGNSQEIRQRLAGNASTYGLDVAAVAQLADVRHRHAHVRGEHADHRDQRRCARPGAVRPVVAARGTGSFSWTIRAPSLDPVTLPVLPSRGRRAGHR